MRIDSITAVAFGPFRDRTLDLAPRLTVIWGPNESGKSSWHAAVYAGLCGMRRGRGQPRAEDRRFAERHRPWGGDAWEVRAGLRLDDGRRAELVQNLENLAACSAVDADLGRDIAAEIINEGTPDGARWLGLDRRSFLAVACVRQAEVQKVAEDPALLQNELQQAATSSTRDVTAAAAIERIEQFRRDQVGVEARTSTRPLRRAKDRLVEAEAARSRAAAQHEEWLALERRAVELRGAAQQAHRDLTACRARQVAEDAARGRRKLERVLELAALYVSGPPAAPAGEELLAAEVAGALSDWGGRPDVPDVSGRPAALVRKELAALPPAPSRDLAPAPEVIAAKKACDRLAQAVELHGQAAPAVPAAPVTEGVAADDLRELALALETQVLAVDPALEARYRQAQEAFDAGAAAPKRSLGQVLAAVALVVGGLVAWGLDMPAAGWPLAAAGLVWLVAIALRPRSSRQEEALQRLRAAEQGWRTHLAPIEQARRRRGEAERQVASRGLPEDPAALRERAAQLDRAAQAREARAWWEAKARDLEGEAAQAREVLARALEERGVPVDGEPAPAYADYERACVERAATAARAARRQDLERELAAREAAEAAARAAAARRQNAERRLLEAARRCGFETSDASAAYDRLVEWQARRTSTLEAYERAAREHAELEALLEGGTVEGLERQTRERAARAEALAREAGGLSGVPSGPDVAAQVARLDASFQQASREATEAEGRAKERAAALPSVAEAEEELEAARAELARVDRLADTLALTLDFLRRAEERIHRDIAPTLAAGLRRWLPAVTGGRYTDTRVDPESLQVTVLEATGAWRSADLLSHGTAEQVYLLLRFVLAERLAVSGETCPLILDDVTVQCDGVRTRAVLEVLRSVSEERQVILFSQEDVVLDWARTNLTSPDDRLVVLETASPAVLRP